MPFSDPIPVDTVLDEFSSGTLADPLGPPWVTPSPFSVGSAPLNYGDDDLAGQMAYQANASDPSNTTVAIGTAAVDPSLYTLTYAGPGDMPALYTYLVDTQDFGDAFPAYSDLVAYLADNGFTPEQYYAANASTYDPLTVAAVVQSMEYTFLIDSEVIPSASFQGASDPTAVYLGTPFLWATQFNTFSDPGFDGGLTLDVEVQTPGLGTFIRIPVNVTVSVRLTNTDNGVGEEYLCEVWWSTNDTSAPPDASVSVPYPITNPSIRTGRAYYPVDASDNVQVVQTYVENVTIDFYPVVEWQATASVHQDATEGWGAVSLT